MAEYIAKLKGLRMANLAIGFSPLFQATAPRDDVRASAERPYVPFIDTAVGGRASEQRVGCPLAITKSAWRRGARPGIQRAGSHPGSGPTR